MTETLPVRIKIGPTGADPDNRIEIGGVDVTHYVLALNLSSDPADITMLDIRLGRIDVEIEGDLLVNGMAEGTRTFIQVVGDLIAARAREGEGT